MAQDESLPLGAVVETVDDGIFVLDSDGGIVWGNASFFDLLEMDQADSASITSFLDDCSELRDLEPKASRDGPTPIRIRTATDQVVRGELTLTTLPDGRYAGWIRDVSERRRLERDLERYRTVLDTARDAIYVTDENRRFTWINAAAERMFGYDRETIVGNTVFEFLDDQQVEMAEENLAYLLSDETPEVITFEMEVPRADGSTFPAETRATLLPGEGFTGTVGIIRDVSDRKDRERELERKNERLEAFADTVSHDLRNPLNVALTRLDLARDEVESEHLAAVERSLERMDDLVDELLTLARQGEEIDRIEPTDVASLADAGWESVATADAELVVNGTVGVDADPVRLQQALENLFRNAVEHGGPDVTVSVGELDEQGGFYVEDDGPGIPAEEREQAFEAGYTTDRDGTGFGLNIVQDIVTAHGWTVSISEADEGGARFEFVTDPDE